MANWTDLPLDLVMEIIKYITVYKEVETFGQVCSSWRHAVKLTNIIASPHNPPWLLLADPSCSLNRQLYHLRDKHIHHVQLPQPPCLLFDEKWRYFSSKGWLISLSEINFSITLVNSFTGHSIQAPNAPCYLGEWSEYDYILFFNKFCLSHTPSLDSDNDFILAMLFPVYDYSLAFWRGGDDEWVLIDHGDLHPVQTNYHDVIYYKGQFYCINVRGVVHSFGNPSGIRSACSPPTSRIVADLQQSCPDDCTCYLVESDGSLLVVFRVPFSGRIQLTEDGKKYRFYETHYFTVWDVNVETGEVKEVSNMGNRALFLGYNSSFSLEASLARGCLPNCIYYCDNLVIYYTGNTLRPGGSDMGVYDLALRHKIDEYYDGPSRYCSISPPLWLEPYESTPFLPD